MPLPLALGAILVFGAEVAVSVAVSYACEKAVESVAGDTPYKYACYLIPGGGIFKGITKVGSAVGVIKLVIRRPFKLIPAIKFVAGLPVKFLKKVAAGGIAGTLRFVGGLARKVLGNTLVRIGIFVALVQAATTTIGYIVNFNFNVSDNELIAQIKANLEQFYELLGGAVGTATGFLMCGALPGTLLFAFNPAVALVVMAELDEEAKSELYGQVSAISQLTFQTLINAELSRQFMNARRYLKRDPKHPIAKLVKAVMGAANFKKWGDDNEPSFTIRENVIERFIESLPSGKREFTENFYENFTESCMESGFIVAQNIDSAIAANVLAQRNIIGNPADVSIILNPPLPSPGNKQPPPK
jgi:hypothetical protein